MTRLAPLAVLLLLAACGTDGAPKAPNGTPSNGPITLSGEARFGISN